MNNNDFSLQNPVVAPAWLSQLVDEELHADATGIIHIPSDVYNLELLDKSSIEFMNVLKTELDILISLFNLDRAKDHPEKAIKIFRIANTVNDFMLYRRSLKMIFSRKAVDLIVVQMTHGQMNTAEDVHQFSEESYWELSARLGNFSEIVWTYRDQVVNSSTLLQYLLTIFIRSSMA